MTVAYQLEEAGTSLSRTTIDRRPLGPRDVRLDLKFCGICHSEPLRPVTNSAVAYSPWCLDTRWWVLSARWAQKCRACQSVTRSE